MTERWAKALLSGLCGAALAVAAVRAEARVDGSSGYTKAQTYSGALRYLRVDLGYDVVEKDPDAAYLIFKYAAPGQTKGNATTGTLEVIEADGKVRLFVSLPRMPEYHERIFRDGLLKKLRDEYGAPPPPVKKSKDKPKEDAKPGAPPAPEKKPDDADDDASDQG
jgi:hypothetical protein